MMNQKYENDAPPDEFLPLSNQSMKSIDEHLPSIGSDDRINKNIYNKMNKCLMSNMNKPKIPRKGVRFSGVVVYSFAREQGFSSIPDNGWCSLGMARRHFSVSKYDIHHFQWLVRLRRRRRRMLSQRSQSKPVRLRAQTNFPQKTYGHNTKISIDCEYSMDLGSNTGDLCRITACPSPPPLSPQPCDSLNPIRDSHLFYPRDAQSTPPPPCLSPPSPRRVLANMDDYLSNSTAHLIENLDTDSEASLDQLPAVQNHPKGYRSVRAKGKLLPIHQSARIRMLKNAGVTRLVESERDECLRVRATRSRVGCNCGPRYPCIAGRCACAEDGVWCQVDRPSFPCSCIHEMCRNPFGRTEFSQNDVRAHTEQILNQAKTISPVLCREDQNVPDYGNHSSSKRAAVQISPNFDKSHDTLNKPISPCLATKTPTKRYKSPILGAKVSVNTSTQSQSNQSLPVDSLWKSSTPFDHKSRVCRVLFSDSDVTIPLLWDMDTDKYQLSPPQLISKFKFPQPKPLTVQSAAVTPSGDENEMPNLPKSSTPKRNCGTPNKKSILTTVKDYAGPFSPPAVLSGNFHSQKQTKSSVMTGVEETNKSEPLPISFPSKLASLDDLLPRPSANSKSSPVTPVKPYTTNDGHEDTQSKEYHDSSTDYVSKSAPNSPSVSLHRLSLRRRAILRAPFSPSKPDTRSPRHIRTTPRRMLPNRHLPTTSSSSPPLILPEQPENVCETALKFNPSVPESERSHDCIESICLIEPCPESFPID